MRRKVLIVLAVIGFGFGVIITRAVWEGRRALAKGDTAMANGETVKAISWWRRSARWYVPFAPHVSGAYDRLESAATKAEHNGALDVALTAWQGIRSSVLATRSFFVPHSERLDPANRRIAHLMAAWERELAKEKSSGESAAPDTERVSWHLEALSRDTAPSVVWSIVALLGFGAWIGGAIAFALRGVSKEDQLVPRIALYSGLTVAVGLFIWMLGLYKA